MNLLGGAALVAREDLADTLRQRRLLRAMILTPLVLWVFIGVGPIIAQTRGETSDANLHASIAVPRETPAPLVAALAQRLRVVRHDDPARALAFDEVDAVLEFRGDPLRATRAGTRLMVREVQSTRTKSQMALGIAEGELQELLASTHGGVVTRQRLRTIAVADPEEARGLISRVAPSLFLVQLLGILAIASGRFQTGRAMRTMEMLLVRPLSRVQLLAGLAVSSILVGLLSAVMVLGPFTAVVLAVAASGRPAMSTVGTVAALVVAVAALSATFAAAGLALGISGKTLAAARTRVGLVSVALLGAGLAFQAVGSLGRAWWVMWTPVLGPVALVRRTLVGSASAVALASVVLATVAACGALFAYGIRYLDSERVTTRV